MESAILTNKYFVAVIFFTVIFGLCQSDQPPYQVSIFIQLHPKGPPIRLCNGVIIHSNLILTTAGCVHYLLIPDKPIIPVHASMLSIVAGSANAIKDPVKVKVEDITIHQHFNKTSMENDIALLHLTTPLSLGRRDDIKWIIMDEKESDDERCLANFHVRNSMEKVPDYTQTEELEFYKKEECLTKYTFPEARKNDICSNYILPSNFNCENLNKFIPFNGDRGTGLICNSHLVGLLSAILPFENTTHNDCSDKPVKALYTNVGSYLGWVYEVMTKEVNWDLPLDDYIASAPFDQELEAFIVSHISDAADYDFPPTTEAVPTLIPDVQPLHGNAANSYIIFPFGLLVLLIFIHFS